MSTSIPNDPEQTSDYRQAAAAVVGSIGARSTNEHQHLLDQLFAEGAAEAIQDYVTVYAITEHDLPEVLGHNGEVVDRRLDPPDVHKALIYQIVSVGEMCNESVKSKVGWFITSLATFLSPVASDKPTRYASIRGLTVNNAINPVRMKQIVDADIARRNELIAQEDVENAEREQLDAIERQRAKRISQGLPADL